MNLRGKMSNKQAARLDGDNSKAISRRNIFRSVRNADQDQDFQVLKHKFPFHGFVECRADEVDFLLFSANDDLVAWSYFWYDEYESAVIERWLQFTRSEGIVLDIGAYTGCMSIIAAKNNALSQVYAFEPIPRTVERLSINVKINMLANRIHVMPFGASNHAGEIEFLMPRHRDFLGTGNSIYQKDNVTVVDTCKANVGRIDEFIPVNDHGRISCIKLDVEGHEFEALLGMTSVIEASRPPMIVEVWKHEKDAVFEYFKTRGYKSENLFGLNWVFLPE